MIKNKSELLRNIPEIARRKRNILLNIADYVLSNCSPEKFFKEKVGKINTNSFSKILLISIGKASKGMAEGILPLLSRKPDLILFANEGHPYPTMKSVLNTKKIISAAKTLGKNDLAIVLISGGGSAMLAAPAKGISLSDKIRTTEALLKSGASIQEINIVRKHISSVKGGRLAAYLYPARVIGFVISDVIGNDLSSIASGPISPDSSTFSKAINIIQKYKIKLPKSVVVYLKKGVKNKKLETPKKKSVCFNKVNIHLLADHNTVSKLAFHKAKKMHIKAMMLKRPISGEARDLAKELIIKYSNGLLIASGETTVTCRGKGYGGRNQEFALGALKYIGRNQTVISIGTDGMDGICPTPTAGAIADNETIKIAQKKQLQIDNFLNNNDSYTFFKNTNGRIITGKTNTNLGDLIMILANN